MEVSIEYVNLNWKRLVIANSNSKCSNRESSYSMLTRFIYNVISTRYNYTTAQKIFISLLLLRSIVGQFIRWVWHLANCRRRLVWQNIARRTSGHRHWNGAESFTKTICLVTWFLSRISLWPVFGRTQKHCHNVWCRFRDSRVLRIYTGICAIGWSNIERIGYWHRRIEYKTRCQANCVRIGLYAFKVSANMVFVSFHIFFSRFVVLMYNISNFFCCIFLTLPGT